MSFRGAVTAIVFAIAFTGCSAPLPEFDGLQPINGTELFVKTMGRGEPVVIVHGGPGFDHAYLLPGMAELAAGHRLVFYDQRASGRSSIDVEPEQITLEQFLDDIEGIRALLGAERIHVLGHSFGGMLAMHYAIRHPDRLSSLVLVNSTAASSEYATQVNQLLSERLSDDALKRQQEILESEAFQRRDPEALRQFMLLLLSANFHDPEDVSRLNLQFPADQVLRSEKLQALAGDIGEYDIHGRLGEIRCPTLIVRGDSELLPQEATERIRDGIVGARLETLKDCGHFSFVECNDELQHLLHEFLAGLD